MSAEERPDLLILFPGQMIDIDDLNILLDKFDVEDNFVIFSVNPAHLEEITLSRNKYNRILHKIGGEWFEVKPGALKSIRAIQTRNSNKKGEYHGQTVEHHPYYRRD